MNISAGLDGWRASAWWWLPVLLLWASAVCAGAAEQGRAATMSAEESSSTASVESIQGAEVANEAPRVATPVVVIDVLVVYTPGVAALYPGHEQSRFQQLLEVSNQIYRDSNLLLELRLAGSLPVDYTDDNTAATALQDLTWGRHKALAQVPAVREQLQADMVVFYRPYRDIQGGCGLAWVGGERRQGDFGGERVRDYMYATVAINTCGDHITAHELGHNMGLRHSRKQDGSGGTFPYALGHGEINRFTTLMAYQDAFNVDYWEGKVYKFSSPDLRCKGSPCGIDHRDRQAGADARRAISLVAPQIARFYGADTTNYDPAYWAEHLAIAAKDARRQAAQARAAKRVLWVQEQQATAYRQALQRYMAQVQGASAAYQLQLRQLQSLRQWLVENPVVAGDDIQALPGYKPVNYQPIAESLARHQQRAVQQRRQLQLVRLERELAVARASLQQATRELQQFTQVHSVNARALARQQVRVGHMDERARVASLHHQQLQTLAALQTNTD